MLNELKATELELGLLINFRKEELEFKCFILLIKRISVFISVNPWLKNILIKYYLLTQIKIEP